MNTYLVTITCQGREFIFCRLLACGADAAPWAAGKFRQPCVIKVCELAPPAPVARTVH